MSSAHQPTVLVRVADAGDTYLSWTWLDTPGSSQAVRLDGTVVKDVVDLLDCALLAPLPVGTDQFESKDAATRRALLTGAFAKPDTERTLSAALTEVMFPKTLREEIVERSLRHGGVHLRVTPSPRLARVPWELLFVTPDRRLLDVAMVTLDPPTTVHAERTVLPPAWSEVEHLPALHILDPSLPTRAIDHGLGRTLSGIAKNALLAGLATNAKASSSAVSSSGLNASQTIDRVDLSRELRIPLSRLFYFGHVSSTTDEPGSASIHLHDTSGASSSDASRWGMAEALRPRTRLGERAPAHPGDHLPLCALDFLLGTQQCTDPHVWRAYGSDKPQSGHEIWPIPSRVALIACEGGVDFRSAETFGLVMAMVDSGASLVTTTRWTLPTDHAFHTAAGLRKSVVPTVELALAVDRSHASADPLQSLHRWQQGQLAKWAAGDGNIAHSPLVWASLTTTVAAARTKVTTPSPSHLHARED
ncbi:CHAT domain-containing protein [Rhodococcus sp. BGS-1C]|uniref:CHAT domain-containing protein n=1 Tax=unclassified Rhodococcus (in: high G+C Gram-positive bacteria) TaxID=192944 RepID=UPI0019D0EB01|nr:CHAT domain-containing protein [Rhodococcus sp. KRD197]